MPLSQHARRNIKLIAIIVGFGMLAGIGYALNETRELAAQIQAYAALRGAVTGALIGLLASLFEVAVVEGRPGAWLRRLPFAFYIVDKTLVYLLIIVACLNVGLWLLPMQEGQRFPRIDISPPTIAYAFVVALLVNSALAVNRLLGRGVLVNFLLGRYHQPRQEERVFLFLDLQDSTAIAERIGDLAFHRLLNRLFSDVTRPILEYRGQIHRYVGDQIIVTWPAAEGLAEARCLRALFDAMARIEAKAAAYRRDFGVAPRFRAALHLGAVVTGEMGDVKREIVFLGDTVNTAARIEAAARERGLPVLASAPLLARLSLPANMRAESIGPVALRGKEQALELFHLARAA
jgi:adenylate cyclase